MINSSFFQQARLMLRVLPHVAQEKCFALKGGTAINFFLRDMPRLSVDIDLTYLPIEERNTSLKNIGNALRRVADSIKKAIYGCRVQEGYAEQPKRTSKLFIRYEGVQIKIEPNEVIRGTAYPCEERDLVKKAEEMFEMFTSVQALSTGDLYGGKLCAVLDRQHPRDIFDIKILMDNEGITDEIRKAFVIYLASHDRPMADVIDPRLKGIRPIYEQEFRDMTIVPVSYEDLIAARDKVIKTLKRELTETERKFLLSVKSGAPEWGLMGIEGIERLPAIQWKLTNIRKMGKKDYAEAFKKLKAKLNL